MLTPVILAGGAGSRLWPLSREKYPKQFLRVAHPTSTMLQATVQRLAGVEHEQPLVLCHEEHRFLAAEQLRAVGHDVPLMLEPAARNTAPSTALAALQALSLNDDPLLLVLPADHLIEDVPAFQKSLVQAACAAQSGSLVTFGVAPTYPETGYGYIELGEEHPAAGFDVVRFLEKPDLETAQAYLATGNVLWNSGMFMFRAQRYLEELELFEPDIVSACRQAFQDVQPDMDFLRVAREAFLASPARSIDYAVMERTQSAAVIPLDAGWCDVGSWSTVWEKGEKDVDENVTRGDVIASQTQRCLIAAEDRLVATRGVQDLLIVETKDAILVAHKDSAQDVTKVVEELEATDRTEGLNHREVYRPWGMYDSVQHGDRYQVKRIIVNPGAKLSVQMHHHRAEHWVVVRGTARVHKGESTYLISENESTFIPVGQVHSLENPGVIPLEVIEVQSGGYLGENDIVRFDDRYGRTVDDPSR